jgi:hypothetical protein
MKFNSRYKRRGWFFESDRHSKAAQGIKTGNRKYMLPKILKEQMENAPVTVSARVYAPYKPVRYVESQIAGGSRYEKVPGRLLRKYPEIMQLQKETGVTMSFEAPGIYRAAAGAEGFYEPKYNHITIFTEDPVTGKKYSDSEMFKTVFHEMAHAKDREGSSETSPLLRAMDYRSKEDMADEVARLAHEDLMAQQYTKEKNIERGMKRIFQQEKKLSPYDDVLQRMKKERVAVIKEEIRALNDKAKTYRTPEIASELRNKKQQLDILSKELGLPEVERKFKGELRTEKMRMKREALEPVYHDVDTFIKTGGKKFHEDADEEVNVRNMPFGFGEIRRLLEKRTEADRAIAQERKKIIQQARQENYDPQLKDLDEHTKRLLSGESYDYRRIPPDLLESIKQKKNIESDLSGIKGDITNLNKAREDMAAHRATLLYIREKAKKSLGDKNGQI